MLLLSSTAFAEDSGPALGNCNFSCERFSKVEDFSGTTLPDGNHTVDFVTMPYGFRYEALGYQYALAWQAIQIGSSTFWDRLFAPSTNISATRLWFPPGIAVGIAILRVRSQGGGAWTISPVDDAGDPIFDSSGAPVEVEVPGGDTEIKTLIICAEEFFSGLDFFSPTSDSEPAIYELCIPQDPEACFAASL